jgi:predicted RNA-binding Zn-ribbon protein involved in translation (DUF1610 family)
MRTIEKTEAELVSQARHYEARVACLQARVEASERRHRLSDRLRHEAESECAALRIACEASDDIRKQVMNSNEKLREDLTSHKGMLRNLSDEVVRLRDHSVTVDADCQRAHSERRAAESSLAAATELLGRLAALDTASLSMAVFDLVVDAGAFLAAQPAAPEKEAIPMFLTCPHCGARHIDEGEFATKVHHTHSCQDCGLTWRPAVCATVGVHFLPGFKNAAQPAAPFPCEHGSMPCSDRDPFCARGAQPTAPACPRCDDPLDADHPTGPCVPCHAQPAAPLSPTWPREWSEPAGLIDHAAWEDTFVDTAFAGPSAASALSRADLLACVGAPSEPEPHTAPAIRDLGTLDIDDGLDEPAAPSLGHPGTDEVFERLQARRAEQRVLDAMSNINTAVLQEHIQTSQGPTMAAFNAELARREVTSGDQ